MTPGQARICGRCCLDWLFGCAALPHCNVDGVAILSAEDVAVSPVAYERDQYRSRPGQEDLTPAECVELPTHRCFTRTTKPHEDRWPFDDRCTEAGAADSA